MRLWTIQKSNLSRSLIQKSLVATTLVWLALQAPIVLTGYFIGSARHENKISSHETQNELIYVSLIESIARFGDLVSARGQVLQIGDKAGLTEIVFCKDGAEVLGRFNINRCNDAKKYHEYDVNFNGEKIRVGFGWRSAKFGIEKDLFITWLIMSILTLVVIAAGSLFTYHLIQGRLKLFSQEIFDANPDEQLSGPGNDLPELTELISSVNEMRGKIKVLHKAEIENLTLKFLFDVSSQVAHDIRSPLSALNMVSSSLKEVPEEKRLLIRNAVQRINDIANDLLAKGKQAAEKSDQALKTAKVGAPNSLAVNQEIILLPALVDSLVSEKRIQLRDQINVSVESDFKDSFGAFVVADGKELMRLLSNLINNAVEAFANETGRVVVAVRAHEDTIHLSLRDNGRGIPPEILQRLGEAGVTHGKEGTQSGSGLGVYHAKKSVEATGGQFKISSQVGVGTMIDIYLPRAIAPVWFLDAIVLKPGMEIISLDDDLTIHGIWRGRLESLLASQKNIAIRNFTSAKDFKSVVKSLPTNELNLKTFLVDYELLGQSTTGLDVIEEMGLQQNVVLVTSRYEEPAIKHRCEALNIKLLPKSLACFVPIRIETPKEKYDWVLIDDDELSHMTWKMAASENNKRFVGFKTPEEFNAFIKNLDPESAIYIDSNLGNGIKGEDIARQLFAEGFINLYLATGYAADQFPPMDFIKSVVGKEPPA